MKCRIVITASLASMVILGSAMAEEGPKAGTRLKSGPQAGDPIPGVFHPLNVTGAGAGQRVCQI
jgi:hypothetical protein